MRFIPSKIDNMAALDELRELAEDMWQNAADLQNLPRTVSGWKATEVGVACELAYWKVAIIRVPKGENQVEIEYKGD